ncbi:MAG: SLC13 family permease [Aigarchaeota archaeon]|nr:SLC13 family permease [Aigarchaeota archaeon]MCX8193401.1 SLC13 family permease [Nitrososphaeria archaeon]MDW7985931.1 SLC13 family permease [Nitrososphaerota archaeon]
MLVEHMKKILAYVAIPSIILISSQLTGFTLSQSLSLTAFTSIIAGAIMFWRFRLAFALGGVSILFAAGLLDLQHFVEYANLDVVVFLICMMIVIGFLEERRFFEILVDKLMHYSGNKPYRTIILLMVLSAVFAAMVDEVTSILFMMSIVINIAYRLEVSLIPLMLMTVFATNIGSSATVIGNPVGVMIAFASGYGFSDFLRWSTPIAISSLMLIIGLMIIYFKPYLKTVESKMKAQIIVKADGSEIEINSQRKIDPLTAILFLGVIGGLVFHNQLEILLNLPKNTMLLGIPMIGAAATILIENVKARELVERRVDWWTILFFLLFFTSVGTLKLTGVTTLLAKEISFLATIDPVIFLFLVGYIIGLMSAIMDNILAVAFWIAVLDEMSALGINIAPLWWAALFGSTYLGNLTIIGSTANIVAVGMVEKQRLAHISLRDWIKAGALASFPPLTLALILIAVQTPFMT